MAVLYVDEAGEEGFKDTSSEWFVLGGALHTNADLSGCINTYEAFKAKQPNKDYFFHFAKRQHDERIAFISAMSKAPYQAMAVMFHKPSIQKPENFQKKYYLYFYALRFLLERATKWAEQTAKEPVHLMLSSRKGLSDENLRGYFDKIKYSPFIKQDNIVWNHFIHDKVHVHANKDYRGLQVADCIASSVFKAVEVSEWQTLESRYVIDLKPLFVREPYKSFEQTAIYWPSVPFALYQDRLGWRL